jgi:riboflavin kinase/FMN adenylyltransferase
MQMTGVQTASGVVQRGRMLGRTLGFPTANLPAPPALSAYGVYAARTRLADGRCFEGVASVGTNPTVGGVAPVLEVWLFDFDEDIYGQTIEIDLVAYLRAEERFADIEAMVAQIQRDAVHARRVLASLG